MVCNAAKITVVSDAVELYALQRENQALKARVAELERLAVRDTLTPVFNRRHFMHELARWCWRNHRHNGEYGLLFIYVDNLKAVNDTHGHLAGDAVLVAIAMALLASVRPSDLVAHLGGDEFGILLDNMLPHHLSKAARLTKTTGALEIAYQGACLKPKISVGFTALEAGIKPVELLLRADRSMYAAKHAKDIGALRQSLDRRSGQPSER